MLKHYGNVHPCRFFPFFFLYIYSISRRFFLYPCRKIFFLNFCFCLASRSDRYFFKYFSCYPLFSQVIHTLDVETSFQVKTFTYDRLVIYIFLFFATTIFRNMFPCKYYRYLLLFTCSNMALALSINPYLFVF